MSECKACGMEEGEPEVHSVSDCNEIMMLRRERDSRNEAMGSQAQQIKDLTRQRNNYAIDLENIRTLMRQKGMQPRAEIFPEVEKLVANLELIALGLTEQFDGELMRVVFKMYGDSFCAHLTDFENLQESPAGFGDTSEEALSSLERTLDEEKGG